MRTAAVAGLIILLMGLTTVAFGAAAEAGRLVAAGAPLAALMILGLHFLRPREELAGWAAITLFLGTTYLGGALFEWTGFAALAGLAALGVLRSPWFLVVAWLGHIPWDFVPRELPAQLADVPLTCVLYDGLVGAYLGWGAWSGRWPVFARAAREVPSG